MNSQLGIPEDLLMELNKFPQAKAKFLSLPPSHKKEYIAYLTESKKNETRTRRIGKIVLALMKSSD